MAGDVRLRGALLAALAVAAIGGYRAWILPESPADVAAVPEDRPDTKWVWENPSPIGEQWIRGGWVFGKRDVWLVGMEGTVIRWDGSSFARVPVATGAALDAAWSPRQGELWIVGGDCTLLRATRRGIDEGKVPGCSSTELTSIWGSDPSDVWVVGSDGFTSHFDGKAWTRTDARTGNLWGVWTASRRDAWAVGQSGVFRWDGKAWSKVAIPGVTSTSTVWGSGPRDVWIGGWNHVHRFDGTTWTKQDIKGGGPNRIWGTGPKDVWFTRHRGISHYDGTAWTHTPRPEGNLVTIHGDGDELWTFGARDILRREGDGWQVLSTNLTPFNFLVSIHGTSVSDVWTIGDRGVLHRDGRSWSLVPCEGCGKGRAVWAVSPRDAWIVGYKGVIFRWDGSSWRSVASPTDETLVDLWGSGANDVWAVGEQGAVLRWDGSAWRAVTKLDSSYLSCVWGSGPDDVWAAGEKVFRWNGTRWREVETANQPPGASAIWGSGKNDVWLGGLERVGGTGLTSMQHWNGSHFEPIGQPFATTALWGRAPGDVWEVGGASGLGGKGLVRHFARGRWTTIDGLVENRVRGVWGDGRSMWIVGENAMILRRDL